MTPPDLFAHPSRPHERRHGPCGYATYDGYKPWLRDEFAFRCVYCLEREVWYPDGAASFSVDHIVAQSEDKDRVCDYTNLVYACTRCNSVRREMRVLDPTEVAFGGHLRLGDDGLLIGVTVDGQYLIKLLRLNEGRALSVRRKYLKLLSLWEKYPADALVAAIILEEFGFPDDMPDLRTKRPPGGNARPGSEHSCYFARRESDSLPATY
jgi:HNH endonuclease